MILWILLLILFHSFQSDAFNNDRNNPDQIVIAIVACGNRAKFHLPSYIASLLDQPTRTKARLNIYLFGDHDIWTNFYDTGCLHTLKSHFHSLIYKNLSDYSSKWGDSLSLLSQFWKFDSRYGCASSKLGIT